MKNLKTGLYVSKLNQNSVSLKRITLESEIDLNVNDASRRDSKIQTGIKFLNHMITGLASRACLSIDLKYKATTTEALDHVIAEDSGLSLGRAIRELIDFRQKEGVNQRGFYTVAFDEALVTVTLSFDGRAYCFLKNEVQGMKLEYVEDILSTSLKQFFEGFTQGAGCVVYIQFFAGEDSHHTWEATFKAFGEALRESLAECPFRKGKTIGLKGTGMEHKL